MLDIDINIEHRISSLKVNTLSLLVSTRSFHLNELIKSIYARNGYYSRFDICKLKSKVQGSSVELNRKGPEYNIANRTVSPELGGKIAHLL